MLPLQRLHHLLPASRLEALAVEYQTDKNNQVRLPGSTVFLCLLHGLLHHDNLTLRLLEEIYTDYTGVHADHSSFGQRLRRIPPDFFAALFEELYAKIAPQVTRGVQQALKVRLVDATTVTLSAKLLHFGLFTQNQHKHKAKRAIKTVWELTPERLPQLLHLCTEPREHADSVALGETMRRQAHAGDLFVFDKGCDARQALLALHQAEAYFLTPHDQQHLRIDRLVWQAPSQTLPHSPPQKGEATFVLTQVAQGVFQNSKPVAKWDALPLLVLSGRRFDARKQQWVAMVLLTNLPLSEDDTHAGPFALEEIATLYAQRWLIEAFFKLLKQYLSLEHLLSRSENGIRVMLYMSLMAALLLVWFQHQTGIERGWRSVRFWFAHEVREWTQQALRRDLRPQKE